MATKLKKLEITKVDLCRAGADPDADILIFKSRDHDTPPAAPITNKENRMSKKVAKIDLATAKPEEIAEYAKSLETQVAEQEEVIKAFPPKKKTDDDEDPDAEAAKKAVAKRLDDQQIEIKKVNDKNAELEAEIKKVRVSAETVELRKTVEADMPKVPGTVDEVVKMLHEAKTGVSAESYIVLTKALKAGSEAIAKASVEIGSGGSTTNSAFEEITKRADQMVADGKAKTRAEAITEVAKSMPELYARYKDEKKKAA